MSVHAPDQRVDGSTPVRYQRVLLVEDEAPLRLVIAQNLTSRGALVREAATAGEALEAVSAELPGLLLLDINLPDRTGWDVLRGLKQRNVQVPTIVVSAVRVSQSRLDEFQPLAYLPKPFPIERCSGWSLASRASDDIQRQAR